MNTEINSRAQNVINLIEAFGLPFDRIKEYRIDQLNKGNRVQVRGDAHIAPKATVDSYAVQMKYGGFPPIVATADGTVIDGNTRIEAAKKGGLHVLDAVIVNAKSDNPNLLGLAAALNNTNGARLTPKEEMEAAIEMLDAGCSPEFIEETVGINKKKVSKASRFRKAENRIRVALGDDVTEETKNKIMGQLRGRMAALSQERCLGLTNKPLRHLISLVRDANLTASEIKDLAEGVRAKGSEATQIQFLEAERVKNVERIREHRRTGEGKPAASRKLRQHIGFINGYADNVQSLVEVEPSMAVEHLNLIIKASNILLEAAKLQKQSIESIEESEKLAVNFEDLENA